MRDALSQRRLNSKGVAVTSYSDTSITLTLPLSPTQFITDIVNLLPADSETGIEGLRLKFKLPTYKNLAAHLRLYILQTAFVHYELQSTSSLVAYPLTFNESADLTKKINKANPENRTQFVRNKLQRALKKHLNRSPAFYMVFESARKCKPHYHGCILLKPTELAAVRNAFYSISGKITTNEKKNILLMTETRKRQHAERLGSAHGALGWADYITKERTFNKLHHRQAGYLAVSGGSISIMKKFYTELREEFKNKHIRCASNNNGLYRFTSEILPK